MRSGRTEASVAVTTDAVLLPDADEAREWLRWLDVPEVDVEPVVAGLAAAADDPEVARRYDELCGGLGRVGPAPDWPVARTPYGDVYVYLAALPLIRQWHADNGISPTISRHTLQDLGAKVAGFRQMHGRGGFDRQTWLSRHFRGTLIRLGRLQFERTHLKASDHEGLGEVPPGSPEPGDGVLDVHIPGDGPLTPQACAESLALAREFFPAYQHVICRSWLLDPQLAEYLQAESNIVRFQRMFTNYPRELDGDADVLECVFLAPNGRADIDDLPQDTSLERAVVKHLKADKHWHLRIGWAPLVQ